MPHPHRSKAWLSTNCVSAGPPVTSTTTRRSELLTPITMSPQEALCRTTDPLERNRAPARPAQPSLHSQRVASPHPRNHPKQHKYAKTTLSKCESTPVHQQPFEMSSARFSWPPQSSQQPKLSLFCVYAAGAVHTPDRKQLVHINGFLYFEGMLHVASPTRQSCKTPQARFLAGFPAYRSQAPPGPSTHRLPIQWRYSASVRTTRCHDT